MAVHIARNGSRFSSSERKSGLPSLTHCVHFVAVFVFFSRFLRSRAFPIGNIELEPCFSYKCHRVTAALTAAEPSTFSHEIQSKIIQLNKTSAIANINLMQIPAHLRIA